MREIAGFDEFVVAASPQLLGTARLICGDSQLAEDLVQETLVRVCLHWASIRRSESATAYAYRTLVRLGTRSGRRLYRSREVPTGDTRAFESLGVSPSAATAQDRDDKSAIREHLMALPLKQRQTLVLRFYADLSVEATAEIMNCSTGTVKSQTAKGLASLRQHLLSSNNTSRGATP